MSEVQKTYVRVPDHVLAGQNFEAVIDGRAFMISVPLTARPGSILEIKIFKDLSPNSPVHSNGGSSFPSSPDPRSDSNAPENRNNDRTNTAFGNSGSSPRRPMPPTEQRGDTNIGNISLVIMILELFIFLFLILSFALPTFAQIQFSNSCFLYNAKDENVRINYLFYQIWHGLSSNDNSCVNKGSDLCIKWDDSSFWTYFDDSTRNRGFYYTSGNSHADWASVQVLIPLASVLIIIDLIMNLELRKYISLNANTKNLLTFCGLFFCTSCIITFSCLNIISLSSSMSSSLWYDFINTIFVPPSSKSPFVVKGDPSDCFVRVNYDIGGSFLATAFSIFIIINLTNLLIWCFLRANNRARSDSRGGSNGEFAEEHKDPDASGYSYSYNFGPEVPKAVVPERVVERAEVDPRITSSPLATSPVGSHLNMNYSSAFDHEGQQETNSV